LKRGLLLLLCFSASAPAHEFRPAYVQLDESAGFAYRLQLRTPLLPDGRVAALDLRLPPYCAREAAQLRRDEAYVTNDSLWRCRRPLAGARIVLNGLGVAAPDALVSLRFADGARRSFALSLDRPDFVFAAPVAHALPGYFALGVEHILDGIDHLLFVAGLLLLVWRRPRQRLSRLLTTITAFTVAHSITLAAALLGAVRLPPPPVEATIAASILLLAIELAGPPRASLALRRPWLPAFAFGLLHGFGFAGALTEIGLPEGARGYALGLFNLGVEAGQLLFVAALLLVVGRVRFEKPAAQLLGVMGGYWLIERTAAMLGVLA